MNILTRILLLRAPARDSHTPAHGCAAALWVWVVFAVIAAVLALGAGHCAAALR